MDDFEIDQFLAETNALDDNFIVRPPVLGLSRESLGEDNFIVRPPLLGLSRESLGARSQISLFSKTSNHISSFPPSLSYMSTTVPTRTLSPPSTKIPSFALHGHPASSSTSKLIIGDQTHPSSFAGKNIPNSNPLVKNFASQSLFMNSQKLSPECFFPSQNLHKNTGEKPWGSFNTQSSPKVTKTQSYQRPSMNPPLRNFCFETQPPKMDYRPFFGSSSNFENTIQKIWDHDREGVMSFLAGRVRPGPDVSEIYKCKICSMEFPNANAYGGHKSSHSKTKRQKDVAEMEGEGSKKMKRNSVEAPISATKKIKKEGKKSKEKGNNEKKKDGKGDKENSCESDESVTGEFQIEDDTHNGN